MLVVVVTVGNVGGKWDPPGGCGVKSECGGVP